MEVLIYAANGMYLVSYATKDMLRLRVLTVAAALCLVAYFYMQPVPMMTVVCWNLFFIALNIIQIARMFFPRARIAGTGRPNSHKAERTRDPAPCPTVPAQGYAPAIAINCNG